MRRLREEGRPPGDRSGEDRQRQFRGNINTCHVWDENGDHVATLLRGEVPPPPMQVSERMVQLGRDPQEWRFG